ncbi:cytochrome P450 [Plantactinospora sp. S1510]|uniref:Cytochrome P450 n=1 Tax=Plantactinospora alkalitolerans TaxID=2789879 RepID=A0ABS0GUN6_9ACTN|nr:cytochrome P450 [Plantactinospora alkalitolerans]MBF9129922.1 cytochrome P450 [Plantactinospora alkalitolerans]
MPTVDLSDFSFWTRSIPAREAAFAELRGLERPPFFHETELADVGFPAGSGYYALVRHADVVEVSRRPRDFCSGKGATSIIDLPPEMNEFFGSMISMDDPKHARLRRIVARQFSREAVNGWRGTIENTARRIVDELSAHGPGDFVERVATRMPIIVICDLLGIPEEDYDFICSRSNILVGAFDPDYVPDLANSAAALLTAGGELADYVNRLAEVRATEPADDIITRLVHANVDGERLTSQELASFFILLVVAGNETTRNAISYGLELLTRHPAEKQLWCSDFEAYATSAVEEIVRLSSPILYMRRTATRDTELNGQRFREGDKFLLFYWSANRDERIFEDPHAFRITRSPNPHIGYGAPGPHLCLGAHLARLEITAIFRQLLARIPDITAEGEPSRLVSNFIGGTKSLKCSFSTRSEEQS